MPIIAFIAKKGRGKDTAADYLIQNYNFTKRAFTDPLKKGIQQWFLFTDEQLFTEQKEIIDSRWGVSPRKVCQIVGSDVVRDMFPKILFNDTKIGDSFWVKSFDIWYKSTTDLHRGNVVVSDVRFQNEVDYIKSIGGIVVKINRPSLDTKQEHKHKQNCTTRFYNSISKILSYFYTPKYSVNSHQSETSVDLITNYDAEINNIEISDFYGDLNSLVSKYL